MGHEFRKSPTQEEYGIIAKRITLINPTSYAILEQIYQFLGNLLQTYNIKEEAYVDDYDPLLGILVTA